MFWTVSLPREWSIRKTWSSWKTFSTSSLSAFADLRSVPNGFSIRILRVLPFGALAMPAAPRLRTMSGKVGGGVAQ